MTLSITPTDGNNDAWQDRTLTIYDAVTNETIYAQKWECKAWNDRQTHVSNTFPVN